MKKLLILLLLALPCLAEIHNPSPGGAGTVVSSPTNGTQVVGNGTNFVPQTRPPVDVRDFGAVGDAKIALGTGASGSTPGPGSHSDCWMMARSAVLNCQNNHFSAGDVGKVISVYGAGLAGGGHRQPLASTIVSYQSPTQITLADAATVSLSQNLCSVYTATWDPTTGTMTAHCSAANDFYPGQQVIFDWSGNPSIDRQVFTVVTAGSPTSHDFTATGNGIPIAAVTFGTSVGSFGYPVTASGRSRRVVWGTDNTAAIQAAVDSAASTSNDDQRGAIILFPPGHYLTHGVQADCTYVGYNSCTKHYNNFWFQGSGRDTTTLENWDPSGNAVAPTGPAHHAFPRAIFDLGYYAGTRDGEGSYYDHLMEAPKITGFTIIQVENPTSIDLKAIYLDGSEDGDISDNYITGPSYECILGGGINDTIHDNHLRECGQGGPAYATGSSAINIYGDRDRVYNNRIEKSGICTELSTRGGIFEGNYCGNEARVGTGVSIGSVNGGVWDIVIRNNTFRNTYRACAIANTIGALNRIYITDNTFINSPDCSLEDGTSYPVGYPVFEVDNVIHGFSEFSHNTLIESNVMITSTYEKWVVDANTIITNQSIPAGPGNSPIYISVAGASPYWLPSHSYANSSLVQRVRPRPDNDQFLLSATGACTSGSSEPTWVTAAPFVFTTSDGTCSWTYEGRMPVHQLSNNRIIGIGGGTLLSGGPDNEYCAEFLLDLDPERVQMENNSISYPGGCVWQRTPNRPYPVVSGTGVGAQIMRIPANSPISDGSRYSWYTYQTWNDIQPIAGYYQIGQQIWQYKPSTNFMWTVTRTGYAAPVWANSQSYSYMSLVVPLTDNGHFYAQVAPAGCTSNSTPPRFPTGTDATVTDSTCTWREVGAAAAFTLH